VSVNAGALSESPVRTPLPRGVQKQTRGTGPAWLWSLIHARLAPVGAALLLLLLLCSIFAGQIAPYDPNLVQVVNRLKPPFWMDGGSLAHPLGTDSVGHDLLSRVIFGTRISMLVGLSSVLVSGVLGTLLGLIAGYWRAWPDAIIMRLGEIQLAFPLILLAIAVLAVLGPGINNLILVLGTYGWVIYARVVRAQTLSWREKEFVEAARCMGASSMRIMFRHILPNVYASLIVIATFAMATNVLAEASLSFLGLGAPPNVPSWGAMLAGARDYLQDAWWLATFPGLALMLTILSVNVVGDWLRDYLDPRLRI
jgi:peptide/nickel transport system permease protein